MEHIEKTDYRINRPIFRHFKNGYKALKLIEATLLSVCNTIKKVIQNEINGGSEKLVAGAGFGLFLLGVR